MSPKTKIQSISLLKIDFAQKALIISRLQKPQCQSFQIETKLQNRSQSLICRKTAKTLSKTLLQSFKISNLFISRITKASFLLIIQTTYNLKSIDHSHKLKVMKRIMNAPLRDGNRLFIGSICLQLAKSDGLRGRLQTLPDQRGLRILRSKRTKKQLEFCESKHQNGGFREPHQSYSIPLKVSRWQTEEGQELKKVKSKIQQRKQVDSSFQLLEESGSRKEFLRIGPLVFVKDLMSDGTERVERQQRKERKLLKNKAQNSLDKIKKSQFKSAFQGFTITPLKVSVELPRIKQEAALKFKNRQKLITPYRSLEQAAMCKKRVKSMNCKVKVTALSPWSTKDHQLHNPDLAMH